VDPVSRTLAEIEQHRPRLLPFLALALILHAGLIALVFLVGMYKPGPRAAHLPTVSVRLIREPTPQKRPSVPAARPRPAATPMPKVTAVPAPTPAPQPTAAPIMPPEESPSQASENAMPVIGAKNTPAPSPRPQSPAQGAAGTGGLSLGGDGDAQGEPGIPSDFQFTYYIDRMLALIESRWYKPPVPLGVGARARFTILRNGKLTGIALEESSGYPTFDRAILRALYAANPLPPLPPAYLKSSLTVHLRFANNG